MKAKNTISRWVVPCYFTEEKFGVEPIKFDLTEHLKIILSNEVWNRKFSYGFETALKNTNKDQIKRANVIIYPRFFSGYVNEKRIPQYIEKHCGKIPAYLKVKSYKDWSHNIGFAIVETEYEGKLENIPTRSDLTGDMIPHFEREFIEAYHRHLAVLKELAAFFLAGLHLSFPTSSTIMRSDTPLSDGFFYIKSNKKVYATKVMTNAFMHEILIETSKLESNVKINLDGLAKVWHYNLWPLKRYLTAVESDQISMDHLLDLLYALEGLFDKNASSDFIKMFCITSICTSKKDAKETKDLLDLAYRIRNDIAHGERSYDPYDKVRLSGKEILAQDVYWNVKTIVAVMIIKGISKLLNNKDMRNLRFIDEDLLNTIFPV